MRFFSFKILMLCILIPPVLYIASAYFLEQHFQEQFTREIEDVYTGDPAPLFEGSIRLKDAVNKNVDRYLQTNTYINLGLKTIVTITSLNGKLLYPDVFSQEEIAVERSGSLQVAAENFALMNEGLVIRVETKFEHNRLLSNAILAACVLLSITILYAHFGTAVKKVKIEDQQNRREIDRLQKMEHENAKRLKSLDEERGNLNKQVKTLRSVLENQKKKANLNEDDLIEEIEALEGRLNENLVHQKAQIGEIEQLRETIQRYEKGRRKEGRQKTKASDAVKKRFNTLYKNISIHDRAVRGFVGLNEEMKIKAEEVIHQLNENPDVVIIKRKVFGGKAHQTVLEVIFAYKGRLYFRNRKDKRVEVLAVGTKNTQNRELEFLARL